MNFRVANRAELAPHLETKAVAPRVAAGGLGSREPDWQFWRLGDEDQLLYGRDIQTWAIVALPEDKDRTVLPYEIGCTIQTRIAPFPWVWFAPMSRTEPVRVDCRLTRQPGF